MEEKRHIAIIGQATRDYKAELKRLLLKQDNDCQKKLQGYIPKSIRDSKINTKIQRNEPCPCGSGKKFKNCCITKNH